jgi:hypothetical protein
MYDVVIIGARCGRLSVTERMISLEWTPFHRTGGGWV